jgi:Bifunctional DNA primase/polymerase, N-terminal
MAMNRPPLRPLPDLDPRTGQDRRTGRYYSAADLAAIDAERLRRQLAGNGTAPTAGIVASLAVSAGADLHISRSAGDDRFRGLEDELANLETTLDGSAFAAVDVSQAVNRDAVGPSSSPAEIRLAVWRNGYPPIPCTGKKPPLAGWQNHVETNELEIRLWDKGFPDATNTGCVARDTPALDVDITDRAACRAVFDHIKEQFEDRGLVLCRIGNAPKFAVPFRTNTPFKKIKEEIISPNGEVMKFEFLCDGQQFITFGLNPDSRTDYYWLPKGRDPTSVPRDALPPIEEAGARALVENLVALLVGELGYKRREKQPDAPAEPPPRTRRHNGQNSAYAQTALDGECDTVARAAPGTRNNTLNTAALKLGRLVGGGELPEGEVARRLFDAAAANGLVKEDGAKATRATIRSGTQAGMKQPRTAPRPDDHFSARATGGAGARKAKDGAKESSAGGAPPEPPDSDAGADLEPELGEEPTGGERTAIRVVSGLIHRTATKAEAALIAAGAPFYTRGGQIIRPIVEEAMATRGFKTQVARVRPVSVESMVDHMSRAARFERYDARSKKFVRIDPPKAVAATVLSRDGEWTFPALAGILTTQTLRHDGSILDVPGYDQATRLLLLDPPPLPPIPDKPTRADAEAALVLLKDLLKEFPFGDAESLAVALSGLMTPVVRGAMDVAPLHAVNAPAPGSGKSYLIDLCSAIATGQRCVGVPAGRDEAETEKRLVGAAITADQIICIDNLNGELGGDFLCQLVERPAVRPRILGGNSQAHMPRIDNRTTVFANGNNITPRADVVRRTLMSWIDTNMERPYEREFRDDPLNRILADRGKYIAACIIIARAYRAAGEPARYVPLASYAEWSRTVRGPLIWLGEADPVKTLEITSEEDPDQLIFAAVMTELKRLLGNDEMTTSDIKDAANEREEEPSGFDGGRYGRQPTYRRPELRQALVDAAGLRGEIDSRRLGHFLRKYKGRVIDGMKLVARRDTHRKLQTWRVQQR